MSVLLVRHGEAVGNRERRFIGHLDVALSELGSAQAQRVAERLADAGIERIVSSDLQRAADTATPLSRLLGIPVETTPELREVNNGDWTGLLPEEIRAGWPEMFADYLRGVDVARPGGERWRQVYARVSAVLGDLLRADTTVAVFTHGGPLLCAAAWATGTEIAGNIFTGRLAPASNGSVSAIITGPRLATWNETGHLGITHVDDGRMGFFEGRPPHPRPSAAQPR